MNKQPKDGESIIQIDNPSKGNYSIGMRNYYQKCSFKEYLDFCKQNNLEIPDFWWISYKDFPFPYQPERLNGKTYYRSDDGVYDHLEP